MHALTLAEGLEILLDREEAGAVLVLLVFLSGNAGTLGHDRLGFFRVLLHELANVPPGLHDLLHIVGTLLDQITADGEQVRNGTGVLLRAGDHLSTFTLHGGAGVWREGPNGIHLTGRECCGCLIGGHAFDHHVVAAKASIFKGQAEQVVVHDAFLNSNGLAFEIGDGCDGGVGNDLVIAGRVVIHQNHYFTAVLTRQEGNGVVQGLGVAIDLARREGFHRLHIAVEPLHFHIHTVLLEQLFLHGNGPGPPSGPVAVAQNDRCAAHRRGGGLGACDSQHDG